mmetsp:Transcript_15279/g.48959  ORF Transcript_15279/g.48959 Transcript_15279/m.48959 type:complete len:355 (-) Transcript_15279:66-1130(-)
MALALPTLAVLLLVCTPCSLVDGSSLVGSGSSSPGLVAEGAEALERWSSSRRHSTPVVDVSALGHSDSDARQAEDAAAAAQPALAAATATTALRGAQASEGRADAEVAPGGADLAASTGAEALQRWNQRRATPQMPSAPLASPSAAGPSPETDMPALPLPSEQEQRAAVSTDLAAMHESIRRSEVAELHRSMRSMAAEAAPAGGASPEEVPAPIATNLWARAASSGEQVLERWTHEHTHLATTAGTAPAAAGQPVRSVSPVAVASPDASPQEPMAVPTAARATHSIAADLAALRSSMRSEAVAEQHVAMQTVRASADHPARGSSATIRHDSSNWIAEAARGADALRQWDKQRGK